MNLTIVQGATFRLRSYLENEDGSSVNVAGARIRAELRTDYAYLSGELVASLANGSGATISADGTYFDLTLPADRTAAMPVSGGVYDVEIAFPDGDVLKPLSGRWRVIPEVTTAE